MRGCISLDLVPVMKSGKVVIVVKIMFKCSLDNQFKLLKRNEYRGKFKMVSELEA